jgi:hypothetical protein
MSGRTGGIPSQKGMGLQSQSPERLRVPLDRPGRGSGSGSWNMEIGHDRANIDQRVIRASMARRGSVGGIGDLDMGPYVGTGEAHPPLVDTGPLGASSAACNKWEARVLPGGLPEMYVCLEYLQVCEASAARKYDEGRRDEGTGRCKRRRNEDVASRSLRRMWCNVGKK